MKLDLGGGVYASFDQGTGGSFFMQSSLRQRMEWSLSDVQDEVKMQGREDWIWILKPSVTTKGTNITIHHTWEQILDALEENSDVREWVLQRSDPPPPAAFSSSLSHLSRYISNPLTIRNHKFHIRVYVLCVGALQVYVHSEMLMLLAAHR
jgi:tubulin---tyrosine ligase